MINCDRRYCGNYFDCMEANKNLCESCDNDCKNCPDNRDCERSKLRPTLLDKIIRENRKNKRE